MKRTVSHTYAFICKKLLKGKKLEELSLRKQTCLQYLKWGMVKRKAEGIKFYELAKRWRKEEREIGGPRTKLEKIARKLVTLSKKEKGLEGRRKGGRRTGPDRVRDRKGFLAPDKYDEHIRKLKEGEYRRVITAHHWILYPPEGEPIKIYNLREFCRQNNLRQNHLVATATSPERRKTHQGWRAEKFDPEWERIHNAEGISDTPADEDG